MTLVLISSLLVAAMPMQDTIAFWLPDVTKNRVLGFTESADGDAASARVITGDSTGLSGPISAATGPHGELYIANMRGRSVTVYSSKAVGNTPPLRIIRGPATGLEGPRGITVGADGTVYVTNYLVRDSSETAYSRTRVNVYAPDAVGDASPIRTIWGSRTGLGDAAGITVDGTGQLYVGNYSGARIHIFAPRADGNVSPVGFIRGGPPTRTPPLNATALALGPHGRLFAASYGMVFVVAADTRDSTPAERIIQGPNAGLGILYSMAIDGRGRIAVLGSGGTIMFYDTTANGDARPVRTIAAPAIGPVSSRPSPPPKSPAPRPTPPQPSIVVFLPGAVGDTPPERMIAGEQTMLDKPSSMAISRDGNLYVLSCQARVTVFDSKAHGNVAPIDLPTGKGLYPGGSAFGLALAGRDTVYIAARSRHSKFGGAVWTYVRGDTTVRRSLEGTDNGPGLARAPDGRLYRGRWTGVDVIDPYSQNRVATIGAMNGGPESELYGSRDIAADSYGLLYVPNADDAVRMYGTEPTLSLRPRRTLAGPHTELDDPLAVAIGPGDTLFVVNRGVARGPSITVYRPYAPGDYRPVRRIAGPRTLLEAPRTLAVDRSGRLYVANNPGGEIGCIPAGY